MVECKRCRAWEKTVREILGETTFHVLEKMVETEEAREASASEKELNRARNIP